MTPFLARPECRFTKPYIEKTGIPCPKCGTQLPAAAKFCFACGEKIEAPSADEITCPACGQKTPKGKFCMQCGAPLAQKCPKCGADVPTGGRFCLQCGEKLN